MSQAILDVRIFGLPVPQPRARARAFQVGGHTRVNIYDPPQAKDWKRTVVGQVLPQKPPTPVDGPLVMMLTFLLPRPASLPQREWAHTKRPDVDNLAKAIKDCLRNIVYHDDAQIVRLTVAKDYCPAPGVVIRIERAVPPLPPQAELVAPRVGEA